MVACDRGMVRNVDIRAGQPAGLSNWRYPAVSLLASTIVILAYRHVRRLRHPELFFDAIEARFIRSIGCTADASVWQHRRTSDSLGHR